MCTTNRGTSVETKHRGPVRASVKKFMRQQLTGRSSIVSLRSALCLFILMGAIMIPIGVTLLLSSLAATSYSLRYDNAGQFADLTRGERSKLLAESDGEGFDVTVGLTIEETLDAPVYVHYEITDYYQNHKRYVRSLAAKQFHATVDPNLAPQCAPHRYLDGEPNPDLKANGFISPCGLIAWSQFNDTVAITASPPPAGGPTSGRLVIDQQEVSWPEDREQVYGSRTPRHYNIDNATRGGATIPEGTPYNEAGPFQVWMRLGARPTIRKLYGVIHERLEAGTVVTFTVRNRYNAYVKGVQKRLSVSTTTWIGGSNPVLGCAWIATGSLSMLAACALFIVSRKYPREPGQLEDLSWLKGKTD